MSKSSLYLNNANASVTAGIVPLGTIIRRFGCNCNYDGSTINLSGSGYYKVNASISFAPTTLGVVTATLYKDGVAIPGAIASATASANGDTVNLDIVSLVRLMCCEESSKLTIGVSSAGTMSNLSVVVEKE